MLDTLNRPGNNLKPDETSMSAITAGLVLPHQKTETDLSVPLRNANDPEITPEMRAKQLQKDLAIVCSSTAPEEEKVSARRRIVETGTFGLEAVDERLKTARGDARNELLRLKRPMALEAAADLGLEMVELDFTTTTERSSRLLSLLAALNQDSGRGLPGNALTVTNVREVDGKAVFNAFCEGLANSKELTGPPKFSVVKLPGSNNQHSVAVFQTKDGRELTLTMVHEPGDGRNPNSGRFGSIRLEVTKPEKTTDGIRPVVVYSGTLFSSGSPAR